MDHFYHVYKGRAGEARREVEITRGRRVKIPQLECNLQKGRVRCTGIRLDTQDRSCICVTLSPLSGDNEVKDTYTVTVTLIGARNKTSCMGGEPESLGKAPRK